MKSLAARATSAIHAQLIFSRRTSVLARHAAALMPATSVSVLDVGCGDGSLSAKIVALRPALIVDGVEVGLRPVTAIRASIFDGRTLPFEDKSRDIVLIVDVLHHTEAPEQLLREAARVARHGIVLKDHTSDPWCGRERLRVMDWVGNIGHGVGLPYNYWTRARWSAAFLETGLVEEHRRDDLNLYPVPLRPIFEDGLHFMSLLTATS